MSEDAPVNTGAVEWPDPDLAYFAVRRMQTKLHQWAGEDLSRRFDDLYNLVCDPAFLVHAWERVPPTRAPRPPASTGPLRRWSRPRSGSGLSWARSGPR
jgi:RNA-directed DNA polymerase